jgi:hypothetical protein
MTVAVLDGGTAAYAIAGTHAVNGRATSKGGFTAPCTTLGVGQSGTINATTLRKSTFSLQFCVVPVTGTTKPWPIHKGTVTIKPNDGTLVGSLGGWVQGQGPSGSNHYPCHLVMKVTSGTGRFANAAGTIVFDGAFTAGAWSMTARVTGVINGGG